MTLTLYRPYILEYVVDDILAFSVNSATVLTGIDARLGAIYF